MRPKKKFRCAMREILLIFVFAAGKNEMKTIFTLIF